MDKSIVCCLVIRNCEKYLNFIFNNLDKLSKYFLRFNVICVYDNCRDNTEALLYDFKLSSSYNVYIINNQFNTSSFKRVRLANARNKYLYVINNVIKDVDYHFVIDSDDINCFDWDYNLFLKYLKRNDWDCISFNRKSQPYNNINDDELLEWSSRFGFNGFAIYRTEKFLDCYYDGYKKNLSEFISDEGINNEIEIIKNNFNDDGVERINEKIEICEHIYYHLSAIKKYNARIRISKEYIENLK